MNILEALKDDLEERYDHVAIWDGEPYATFPEFRMVFEVAPNPIFEVAPNPNRKKQQKKGGGFAYAKRWAETHLDRAVRYVDIQIDLDNCVVAFCQNRKTIKVSLEVPDAFDQLDAFIHEQCLTERAKLRNIGSLHMSYAEEGTKNLRPRSSIG